MKFGEKLRAQRLRLHMTQEELARRLALSKRTVEGYESGAFYPRNREVYDRMSELFGVDKNWLLTEDEEDTKAEAERLIAQVRALYAGGTLCQADEDAMAQAMMDAYFIAKAKRAAQEGKK